MGKLVGFVSDASRCFVDRFEFKISKLVYVLLLLELRIKAVTYVFVVKVVK